MKIVGWIFTILLTFSFVQNAVAQKQRKLVENLDIQGNRRLRDDDLLKLVKIRPGDVFKEKKVQKDLQSLLKMGFFYPQNTRVITEEGVRGGVNVIFEVRELHVVEKLSFTGLRFVKLDEILDELRKKKITMEAGMLYDQAKVHKARRIIREFLNKRGYPNAKVVILEEEVSATTLNLTFEISELPNQ